MTDKQEQPVSMEPVAYIHRQGNFQDVSYRHLDDDEKESGWTEEPLYTATQLAAARQQGADEHRKEWAMQALVDQTQWIEATEHIAELERTNAVLLEALKEAEYALDYAADMTKPEGLSGCDCPICSVTIKVRATIAAAEVKPCPT